MELIEFNSLRLLDDQKKTLEKYKRLNTVAQKSAIVLTGSSLMDFFPVNELAASLGIDKVIYNRGITGYVTSQLLEALDTLVLDLKPEKLFINIGTNDLGRGLEVELWENYPKIISQVQRAIPNCEIFIMAFYPCNNADNFGLTEEAHNARFKTRTPESLRAANCRLEKLAAELGCRYIDVNDGITDSRGLMKAEYCIDGVHMYADGYISVLMNLAKYF